MSGEVHQISVKPVRCAEHPAAKRYGAAYYAVEDRLHVRRRAADDAQNLGGGRLLLEGLGQVAVAGLQLLEQADILDGDDRLIGKRLEELDLRLGERLDL